MGATPNAMANMQAICDKYAPSIKAYLLIPIVGSLFADFINSLVNVFLLIWSDVRGMSGMKLKKLLHIEDENVAVPEIHIEEYEGLQDEADRRRTRKWRKGYRMTTWRCPRSIFIGKRIENRDLITAVFRSRALPAPED